MASDSPMSRPLRIWILPLSILLGAALTVFVITYWVDASGTGNAAEALRLFFHPNPNSALGTLSNASEVVAAVLAIAITVVAIVVELAANRYTHRITELFVSNPINFGVMGLFVITSLLCLWVSTTFDPEGSGFVPFVGIAVSQVLLALCLLILLPYFAYVFTFLSPVEIVGHIRRQTLAVVLGKRARTLALGARKREAVRGVEQLADIGLNAMENKDKGISMESVDALKGVVIDYQQVRRGLPEAWFRVEGDLAHNPDFVSMSPEVLEDVTGRRIWFEMKVLRQYQTIYNEALNRMRDVNYVIAINTRQIGEAAAAAGNEELVDLVIKFFNTYLRATVNARDVRTAYNVLNQYRLFAESMLNRDGGARALEIARYFKYYGLASFSAKLPFILETAAYDLCTLNELAFAKKSEAHRELLRVFLQVDKESESDIQELSLRGVRKAQVKLATFYLLNGAEDLAREVFRDMEAERPERLASIRDELLGVRSREFWEISDRGVNFDYLSPERKAKMLTFFGWFGSLIPPRPSRLVSLSDPPPRDPSHGAPQVPRDSGESSLHDVPAVGRDPGSAAEAEDEPKPAPVES